MKQSIRLVGGIEQLFGTRDENLKLLESVLSVTTSLRDNTLEIEGEPKQVDRIILVRPAVEAGERLGFLPGTIQEKVDPYMRPLYDALYDMLEADRLERYLERGIVEVAPLAFMRGRTLNDSFVILDEAQNTTSEQMKMFLTRLGFNSKAVITGDITQIDLPPDRRSGLVEAMEVVGRIEGIAWVYFTERDVVRHNLVQKIIRAYEEYESRQPSPNGSTLRRNQDE